MTSSRHLFILLGQQLRLNTTRKPKCSQTHVLRRAVGMMGLVACIRQDHGSNLGGTPIIMSRDSNSIRP